MTCPVCKGRGWVIWVYPERMPRPAYWFNRGPDGERPSPCDDCNAIDSGYGAAQIAPPLIASKRLEGKNPKRN